jgi:hypothetical protein
MLRDMLMDKTMLHIFGTVCIAMLVFSGAMFLVLIITGIWATIDDYVHSRKENLTGKRKNKR